MLPDPFSGGFGLLTVDGIPKPQFYALKLMSQAGGRKYDLPWTNEETEISVYESDTEKQVFVYRQRMKNVNEAELPYEVELELGTCPSEVLVAKIDKTHCNPQKVWEEMGKPMDMNRAELEELRERSKLVWEPQEICYQNGILFLKADIGVNDVHCYKIKQD